ncbi:MAG TPA: DUF1385 domain-containing protein [Dehalococcoidales bacterium]|nr:DUF1385 domain-containing protein [Dehalococcoidales bacterium]
MADNKVYFGGQAVIEGVMMRGKRAMAVAIRRPNGEIGVQTHLLHPLFSGKWRRMPIIRGILALIESLALGIQTLMYSANVALEEEKTQLSGWTTWGIIIAAMTFSVGIFFLLPLLIANPIKAHVSVFVFNLVEGVVRVLLFVIYLVLVSRMKDIQRVFGYHGAEHKAINAFEAGDPLEVKYARNYSTANPRCGTSFLFAVLIIAILVFSLVGKPSLGWLIASRILLLPVIAALAYEFIYYTSRHCNNPVMKVLMQPGLWLQSLSTREPDDQQLEVALEALKHVVAEEKQPEPAPQPVIETAPLPAD